MSTAAGDWVTRTPGLLLDTFAGSFQAAGVAVAAACVDVSRVVTTVSPAETPPRGRFEIGSVTKTMTATLLALLAQGGTLRLGDEIGRWLSAGRNGGITLRQLATHTSGLPALCPGLELRRAGRSNPYAALTAEAAEEGLRQAAAGAGAGWRYSNFGYQLLGLVLERASGQHYHALAAERLLGPLAMTSTGAGRHGGGTVLPGHAKGHEVPHWDAPLPGHGGIELTAGDLARYAGSVLRPPPGPLGAAITLTQSPQVPIPDGRQQALGWVVHDGGLRGHNGQTGGFCSSVLIDPGQGRAVVILVSNGGTACLESAAQAVQVSIAGGDPRVARLQPPGPGLDRGLLERFNGRAREAVRRALEHARESGHSAAGTGHLLLALCGQEGTLASQVLAEAGVRKSDVGDMVAAEAGPAGRAGQAGREGAASAGEPSFTSGVAAAVRDAEAEALNAGHSYIGTEHLLLVLFLDTSSPAAQILARLGLTYDAAAASTLRRLASPQR